MECKRIIPGSANFGVASSNAGVHFQLQVNSVYHVSTVQRTQVQSLSCFLLRLEFVHAGFFSVLPCFAPSCSDQFYSQALLRRLHGGCAHVGVCICLSACACLRLCLPYYVNPVTCSSRTQAATGPHCLQPVTDQFIGALRSE